MFVIFILNTKNWINFQGNDIEGCSENAHNTRMVGFIDGRNGWRRQNNWGSPYLVEFYARCRWEYSNPLSLSNASKLFLRFWVWVYVLWQIVYKLILYYENVRSHYLDAHVHMYYYVHVLSFRSLFFWRLPFE